MEVMLLRFDAPLMAFGGPAVDKHRVIRDFPGKAMLTGLLANALGWEHRSFDLLARLQSRLSYAVRVDRPGERIVDYQTVDLGQDFLYEEWTTRGRSEGRQGGTAKEGTHIRYRHYWADRIVTLALTLVPVDETPNLHGLATALDHPARPLFLGRKACLPSQPIKLALVEAESLYSALVVDTRIDRSKSGPMRAQWPVDEGEKPESRLVRLTDERDWSNQIHCGGRLAFEGLLMLGEGKNNE